MGPMPWWAELAVFGLAFIAWAMIYFMPPNPDPPGDWPGF